MTATACKPSLSCPVTDEMVAAYRRDGFVKVPGVLTPEEVALYAQASLDATEQHAGDRRYGAFDQTVNIWRKDPLLKQLTLHPVLAAAAKKLHGGRLRIWHDHILIKRPQKSTATEFHQDKPYWPHATSPNPLSAWIALCDVPVEKGCMTFLPGSQNWTSLPAQDLNDSQSLANICGDMRWIPRVTMPLRAGECTFHHGLCAHMATPNHTPDPRIAYVIIYMDETATYSGIKHIVTDPLNLQPGDRLDGELFPEV
ncbi:MAG: phytanoyl-CoA dioxygenase family protein [Phycisphaeraceae bacterium]|nr:phytanoyl-CoA dioxygenase family protein [Phycisphaeraceae bacterium]